MARLARVSAAFLLMTLYLQGCSTTWVTGTPPSPTSYAPPEDQLSRSAGQLRRLLVLPADVTSTDCPQDTADRELSEALYEGTKRYLEDWKGYEILTPGQEYAAECGAVVEYLGSWQEGDVGEGIPARNECVSVILETAGRARADGFVVLHGTLRCLNAVDITLYFMIVGMPNWRSKLFDENLSAGIYEARGGRLVWKQQINVIHPNVGGGTDPASWAGQLFDGLENAIPAILLH